MVRLTRRRSSYSKLGHSCPQSESEFFKIYLPDHNSKALSIPPAFTENFKGEIPKKAILKNSQGKCWQVKLEKINDNLLFKNGWQDYVHDQSLDYGDFLIFRYNGNAVFTVKVFGVNGCEKGETSPNHSDVKVEERQPEQCMIVEKGSQADSHVTKRVVPKPTNESSNPRFSRVFNSKRPWNLVIPERIFRECNIIPPQVDVPERIILRSKFEPSLSTLIRRRVMKCRQRMYHRVYMNTGWRGFRLNDRISTGDKAEFEIIVDQGRKIREIVLVKICPKRMMTRSSKVQSLYC